MGENMRKCRPQEIIKAIPKVQTVVLPNDWFNQLSMHHSVFHHLYLWMLENDRVPPDENNTLHNRTYVGATLYKRLVAFEKKRLKMFGKLKGNDLENELMWSDRSRGPRTHIGGLEISGDGIFVIPESSRSALAEFASKISEEQRHKSIEKISKQAAGATFRQWLLPQINRPDRVGDLAIDVESDEDFPKDATYYEEIRKYLRPNGDEDKLIGSLKIAWLEYIQQYPNRVKPLAWCSECLGSVPVEEAFLAWRQDSNDYYMVLDAICLPLYNDGVEPVTYRPLSRITQDDIEDIAEREGLSEYAANDIEEKLKLWGIFPPECDSGLIYFIQNEGDKSIKIGYTGGDAQNRKRQLQTNHSSELHLLATCKGSLEYESALQHRFAKHRLRGEWFRPHPDILAFISKL